MRIKNLIVCMLTMAFVFGFAVMGMADDGDVQVDANVQNVAGDCDRAGGFTLSWAPESQLDIGHEITATLPRLSKGVTLCNDVKMVIAAGFNATADSPVTNGTFTKAAVNANFVGLNDADLSDNSTVLGHGNATTVNGAIWTISGDDGGDVVTIEMVNGSVSVGPNTGDAFTMDLFKQDALDHLFIWNPEAGTDGMWVEASDGASAQNVWCIDPAEAVEEIQMFLDSDDGTGSDIYAFDPNSPNIAIPRQVSVDRITCKGDAVGTFEIPECAGEQEETPSVVDFEDDFFGDPDDLWCSYEGRDLILQHSDSFSGDFTATVEVFVNGGDGSGAFFVENTLGYATQDDNPCTTGLVDTTDADLTGELADETSGVFGDGNLSVDCEVPENERIVKVETENGGLVDLNGEYLVLNLPALTIDPNLISAGDVVTVVVTMSDSNSFCGETFSETITFGNVVDTCPSPGVTSTLTLPYISVIGDSGAFWEGLAVTNLSTGQSGSVTATFYETDGDQGQMTFTLDPAGMFVNTLGNALAAGDITQTAGAGTLGDNPMWATLVADGINIDAFLFLAKPSTGESMGYLARRSITSTSSVD